VDRESLTLDSHSVSETRQLGALISQLLDGQEVICLEGELGTGKTTLIQAIGDAQGVSEAITSPTFTLVNEYYSRTGTLYHVDLYRLGSIGEIVQAGIDAFFYADGICVIEWAEKARGILPAECLYIMLKHEGEEQRSISIQAKGQRYCQLLRRLRKALES